jgi:pimeloyl-ACP methyl ester carboxylesterase
MLTNQVSIVVGFSPLHLPAAEQPTSGRTQPGRLPVGYARIRVSGGRTMHVTMVGPSDGVPTVALHGLGGNTEQMLPALEAVAEHYGLRTYAIDLPNHGRSGKVGISHFRVQHFSALISETVRALQIEPTVVIGHSFGGQLAAILCEELSTNSLQPIFINPALGTLWDRKLRRCWRRPWLFFKLIEELGYNEGNVTRGELYHAGRLLGSLVDMVLDRNVRPYPRLQATMALLLNMDTASILHRLAQQGIEPVIVQGVLDKSTPAGDGARLVDGFHDWLHETSGPGALVAALNEVFPGGLSIREPMVGHSLSRS